MFGMTAFQNQQGNFEMYGGIDDGGDHANIHWWEYDLSTYQWAFKQVIYRDGETVTLVAGLQNNVGDYVRLSVDPWTGLYFSGSSQTPPAYAQKAGGPLAMFQNHGPNNLNYEIFSYTFGSFGHSWIDSGSGAWSEDQSLGQGTITGVAAFQDNANLNYEVLIAQDGNLTHWWRDWNQGKWYQGAVIGSASGAVAAFQNPSQGNLYNFEVFAVQDGNLRHFWRDWNTGTWYEGAVLGSVTDGDFSQVAAFFNTVNQNYEVFALNNGTPYHWWRDASLGQWFSGDVSIDMGPKN